MTPASLQRQRARLQQLHRVYGGHLWFPHVPLTALLVSGGLWMLHTHFAPVWRQYLNELMQGDVHLNPHLLFPLLVGAGMVTMGLALLWRSRLAWVIALLLAVLGDVNTALLGHSHVHLLLAYFSFIALALVFSWRQFDRTSLAASTLFAVTSILMLVLYATFGSFYLGKEFHPPIHDLITALYYALVTMCTVGYGDIVPTTAESRLFALSVIVLGVAVFATSLTTVIAPLVGRSVQRIVNRKGRHMKREDHFVVIGNTPLAVNTWHELTRRNHPVTRLVREPTEDSQLKDVDLVVGDPSSTDVLREVGAHKAQAVLAMLGDDSENAFCVLAVRELAGKARTLAVVNDARHLSRVKLTQPDILIAPQVLGGELTAMLLSGEEVTSEFVMQRVFLRSSDEAPGQPG